MKYILLILMISIVVVGAENYKKVKIKADTPRIQEVLESLGVDHYTKSENGMVEFFLSDKEYGILQKLNIYHEVIIDDWFGDYKNRNRVNSAELENQLNKSRQNYGVTSFDFGSMGGYYTLDEVYEKLDNMFGEYPAIITEKTSIGKTNEGKDIYFVKISDNPDVDEEEPEVLYTALHHAREPESMMQMIYFMYYLLENYGSNAEATFLVENRELYFIPVVNPDGYDYNRQRNPAGGGMWRKNRRDNGDGNIGVDLNRNYGPLEYWNASNGGSSSNSSSDVYRGTEPFSEPETKAVRDFLYSHDIKACLNYHTYSNLLIYPYGALGYETADSLIFREFAKDMTRLNNYLYGTDIQTVGYTTRGNSDDYMYDGEIEQKGKIIAMTPEVGGGSDGFWPDQNRILPLAEENLFPNLYYAWITGGFVTPNSYYLEKEIISPGDTAILYVSFKNKGLSDFGEFTASLSTESDEIIILDNEIKFDGLASRQETSAIRSFRFILKDFAQSGQSIDIYVTTSAGNIQLFSEKISFRAGAPKTIFTDYFNDQPQNWDISTNVIYKWDLSGESFFSSPSSITDSKGMLYASNSIVTLKLKEPIDLTGTNYPLLIFNTKFEIEKGWDYGECLISSNNGLSWQSVPGKNTSIAEGPFQPSGHYVYSGRVDDWVKEEVDLSGFINQSILIKFVLYSDEYVEFDGWYIDDLEIIEYQNSLTNADNSAVIFDYKIEQNYPNPFNPGTNISYFLPKQEFVSIIIYDILGNKISTLVNEIQESGFHSVYFDSDNLDKPISTGIYFYRMWTNNYSKTSKMLFMK